MKSERLLRTNRRGYTVAEVVVASSLVVIVLAGLSAVLSMAATMEQAITLQMDADNSAVQGMNRMITEIREAKEVTVVQNNQFRIFYPVMRANGMYDRFVTDTTYYVQYAQTNERGVPSTQGKYLWRSTNTDFGRAIAKNVKTLAVTTPTSHSIRLTLRAEKTAGSYTGATELNDRVLYLRNN